MNKIKYEKPETVVINMRIPKPLKSRLEAEAKANDVSEAQVVRIILDKNLP